MKTLTVLEGNCGDEGDQYRDWLKRNLPSDIELDYRPGTTGVSGGLYDDNGDEIEGGGQEWWDRYCNG